MFTDEKHFPFPEAIDRPDTPDRFDISTGPQTRTNIRKGVMVINAGGPCDKCGQDHARASRLHEMGHVAWTPGDWEKRVERAKDAPPLALVNAVEDARITRLREGNRLDPSPSLVCANKGDYQHIVDSLISNGDLLGLATVVSAAVGSADYEGFRTAVLNALETMRDKGFDDEALAVQRVYDAGYRFTRNNLWPKSRPSFRTSISTAREILEAVAGIEEDYREAKEIKDAEKTTKVIKAKGNKPKSVDSDLTWGAMSIVKVPLTKHSKLGMERKWTARDEGPIPTRFDRWSIDKRVFRVKKRAKGAAVLVDVSGSMSWSEDDLARVLDEVPAATVAIYSGSGAKGKLVIVARKGRRAKWSVVKQHKFQGNVIDGPALEWLASQPESVKVWMSDGGITGPYDSHRSVKHTETMISDVRRHLRRGQIMRVRDAGEVMRVLAGKERFVPTRNFKKHWSA